MTTISSQRTTLNGSILYVLAMVLLAVAGHAVEDAPNEAMEGRSLIVLDSTGVRGTNLQWGQAARNGTGYSVDLHAENSLEPAMPYFAEFTFGVKPHDAGEYQCWALVLACNESWISPWNWRLDGSPAQEGKALSGSLPGGPRWVRFGVVDLAEGNHALRITVTGRRVFPDDAYLFHLWKVILAPTEVKFSPAEANIALGYNPQGNQQVNVAVPKDGPTGGVQQQGRLALYRSGIADPVELRIDVAKALQPVQPIWRDLSEGGIETGGDFLLPQLIKPLRPRFIRKCHVLSLVNSANLGKRPVWEGVCWRSPDGTLQYDFSEAHVAIKAILAVGAEPIVDLANPPAVISYGMQVKDWATNATFQKEWFEVVTAFLKSLKDNNLPVKYFTSFNEPEFSVLRTNGCIETSLMINRVAAKAVKSFDPGLQMAGMEFGNARSDVFEAFLNEIGKNPENIDIFSFHQYQSSPERQAGEILNLRKELDKRSLQRVKIAVDEWEIASSGQEYHRTGVRTATYHASCIKAMVDAGLDIGGLFCPRDYPNDGWQWGLITRDGFLKPAYWGQWLWAQLPDRADRLSVTGGDERVQSIAFRDGDGIAVLIWYEASENAPVRNVTVKLNSAEWAGYTLRLWQLDSMRHIGYIPEGSPVELPYELKSMKYGMPMAPSISFQMLPVSMRLIKLQPLTIEQDVVPRRPILLDNAHLSTGQFRALQAKESTK